MQNHQEFRQPPDSTTYSVRLILNRRQFYMVENVILSYIHLLPENNL